MDSSFWVAIAGILGTLGGTLGGVWFSHLLQNRKLKLQREWDLQDRKSEWIRNQKKEDYASVLAYVEGAIQVLTIMGDTLESISKEKQEELLLELNTQVAKVMLIIEGIKASDKTLANLFEQFYQEKLKVIKVGISAKNGSKGNINTVRKIAGQIKNHINGSLAETFN